MMLLKPKKRNARLYLLTAFSMAICSCSPSNTESVRHSHEPAKTNPTWVDESLFCDREIVSPFPQDASKSKIQIRVFECCGGLDSDDLPIDDISRIVENPQATSLADELCIANDRVSLVAEPTLLLTDGQCCTFQMWARDEGGVALSIKSESTGRNCSLLNFSAQGMTKYKERWQTSDTTQLGAGETFVKQIKLEHPMQSMLLLISIRI